LLLAVKFANATFLRHACMDWEGSHPSCVSAVAAHFARSGCRLDAFVGGTLQAALAEN
jgi:hypothetical protein